MSEIRIRGAKEHNLKNIDVDIPRDKLVVFTGLSGSGKSSLAFDTIFAEGQRRYVESLSSYARQFLGQMDKPDVESIEGLSPAISIDQKTTSQNPRSTVGTVTEIYDYLRLLFARIGIPHCPVCGREITSVSVDQIVDKICTYPAGTKFIVLAPVVRGRKGEYVKQLESLKRSGYVRVKVDGNVYGLDEEINLDKNLKHNISVVVDRLVMKEGINRRLSDSIETALKLADGLVVIEKDGEEELFSTDYSCPVCGISIGEITPRMFSFNSPYGACESCSGLGFRNEIDVHKLIPDPNVSIRDGAIKCTGWNLDIISESRLNEIMLEARRALVSHGVENETLIDTLFTLGYNRLEHIARVDPLELAQIPGFGMDNAEHIVAVAQAILAETRKARNSREMEEQSRSDIKTYLGLTDHQAKQFYEAGYHSLGMLFMESDPQRLDAKTGIGRNKSPEVLDDLTTIAINHEVYTEQELAQAREIFNRCLLEIPNATLQQAYNCVVEELGERIFPSEEDDDDESENAGGEDVES